MSAPPLTPKQLQVLESIRHHQEETSLSPTMQELGAVLAVNRVTVYGHVRALLQKGYLENLEPGASRGLDFTDLALEVLERRRPTTVANEELVTTEHNPAAPPHPFTGLQLPLLGRIAAGSAIEVLEDRNDIDLSDFLNTNEESYMLEVQGDSMIEAHIQSGDFVVIRRDITPRSGDIVVAILEGDEIGQGSEVATLKRFFPQPDGSFILQPANAALQPIYCDRLEVRGVVTGVLRSY